jgi:hypothetical protein
MLARKAGILANLGLWELQTTHDLGYSLANGLMESWVVHARILIEFLHKPAGGWSDTVTIVDCISDPCLRDDSPEFAKLPTIKDAYDKACQEVVHPSIDRNWRHEDTRKGKSSWEFVSLTHALLTQIRKVAPLIPSERIPEAYRTAILAVSYDGPAHGSLFPINAGRRSSISYAANWHPAPKSSRRPQAAPVSGNGCRIINLLGKCRSPQIPFCLTGSGTRHFSICDLA